MIQAGKAKGGKESGQPASWAGKTAAITPVAAAPATDGFWEHVPSMSESGMFGFQIRVYEWYRVCHCILILTDFRLMPADFNL